MREECITVTKNRGISKFCPLTKSVPLIVNSSYRRMRKVCLVCLWEVRCVRWDESTCGVWDQRWSSQKADTFAIMFLYLEYRLLVIASDASVSWVLWNFTPFHFRYTFFSSLLRLLLSFLLSNLPHIWGLLLWFSNYFTFLQSLSLLSQ